MSPRSIIEHVEERVGDFVDEEYTFAMCDRLWSGEAMIELEKLLVCHINKYLPPIYEVVNVVQKESPVFRRGRMSTGSLTKTK